MFVQKKMQNTLFIFKIFKILYVIRKKILCKIAHKNLRERRALKANVKTYYGPGQKN